MNRLLSIAAAAAAITLLAGCGSDSDGSAALRIIHASPNAPAVNVLANDIPILSGVQYKQGSGFLPVTPGSFDFAVQAVTPAGTPTVLELADTLIENANEYTVLAVGRVGAGVNPLDSLVIANPVSAVPAGETRVQVVHASPDAPAVDVYVTAPGAALGAPLGSFAFGGTLGPVTVPAGNYRVRVTAAGDPAVLYDSGTVAFAAGADLLVAAVTSELAGTAPISLLVNDGASQAELLDQGAPRAAVRVAHLSPDAPAVDVIVNDDFANPAFSAATFPGVTAYAALPPATYNFKVVDNATQSLTVINADQALASGGYYTVAAVNTLASIEPLVLEDRRRSIATEAQVRIVHASPAAGNVDIYVTAPGADITLASPDFANVPFKADTGFVSLAGGAYQIRVTTAGLKTPVAIDVPNITLAAGSIYNAFARDAVLGGAPLGVLLVDELAP